MERREGVSKDARLLVLRLDRSGNVVGGNPAAVEWISQEDTRVCHRLVGAKNPEGKPICRPGCAWELGVGLGSGHERLPVLVNGSPARLTCQHVGEGAVVVLEPEELVVGEGGDPSAGTS